MQYACALLQNTHMVKQTEAFWQAIENLGWPWELTGTQQILVLLQGADMGPSQEEDSTIKENYSNH